MNMTPTALRFAAAQFAGMKYVTSIAGFPLFDGTPAQLTIFHQFLGTPTP